MSERQIFEHALQLTDSAQRDAFLSQACGDDLALRQRIEALLNSDLQQSRFLETPVVQQLQSSDIEKTQQLPPRKSIDQEDDDDEQPQKADLNFLMPSTKPGSIGVLGHYEILQVLGQGAFGIVFKAFDEKLQRYVAIKTMNVQMAATSPPRKRFLREARAAAAIRHDNVTQVYSVEEEPIPYLVMEYIDGVTLSTKLDSVGPLEIPELLHLGKQIAAGLAAAHDKGLVHRDIKPGNILLEKGAEQKVKITDFGLARAADDASLTQSGLIAGTPLYMAPEQALGQALDARTDLFSFGSVLYAMASGHPPFRAPTTVAVLRRVVDDTQRPLKEVIPEIPEWFAAIVNKLLAKKADDRYQSAKEVADLLGRCQSELQLKGEVTCVSASGGREPSESPAKSKPDRRSPTTSATSPISTNTRPPLAHRTLLLSVLLGLLVMLPIIFGKPISRAISNWYWGPIPALPVVERAAGLKFDGKDDYVAVNQLDWAYPQFTIEAFVTSPAGSDNGNIVTLAGGEGDNWEMMGLYDGAQADPGERVTGAQIGGQNGFQNAVAPLTAGVRQHRALVYDGTHLQYYVNGQWQGKRKLAANEAMQWKFTRLRFGSSHDEKKFFEGQLDQVRISRVARYTENFPPVASVTSDEMTLALYNFDEGQGDVLKDVSGHGHDGKIVGATWVSPASGGRQPSESPILSEGSRPPLATGWHGWPADAPKPAIAPFDAEQARKHQEAWAAYLKVPVEYTNSIGMKFRLIPPGEFTMGSSQEDVRAALNLAAPGDTRWQNCIKSEAPQHKVILTQAKYLSVHEVTQSQYERIMGQNPSHFATTGAGQKDVVGMDTASHPVEMVSWNDATEFCAILSQQEKLKPFYFRADETVTRLEGMGYRLPSEAEWEFACRAGTTTRYWISDQDEELLQAGWCRSNARGRTHVVGELKENPFGLYDVHGNVWEWVQDGWERTYYKQFQGKVAIDPEAHFGADSKRVFRGGHWLEDATFCRASHRDTWDNSLQYMNLGFRVTLTVDAVRQALKLTGPAMPKLGTASAPTSGEWIDVIPLIDPAADKLDIPQVTGRNGWRKENTDLVIPSDERGSKVLLPLDSAWSAFECELDFTRRAGSGGFNVNLPTQQGECSVVVDHPSGPGGVFLGARNKGVVLVEGPRIETGKRSTLRIELRREQNADRVSVAIDETTVGQWSGDRNEIGKVSNEGYPIGRRLSLWIHEGGNEFVFHRIRVRMLDRETATMLRPVPPTKPSAPPPAIAPFTAEQAKQHQEEWAAYLKVPVEYTNSIGMKFRLIPPGEFTMGSRQDEIDAALRLSGDQLWRERIQSEGPQFRVILTQPFYASATEVTQSQYQQVMGTNPSYFASTGEGRSAITNLETSLFPVETVSWNDAAEFCAKLCERENWKPLYFRSGETVTPLNGNGYRLLTEAQWEFACRAGTVTKFWSGDQNQDLARVGWIDGNSGMRLHAVGELSPNPFGLFDVHGNVWEWVEDGWEPQSYAGVKEQPAKDHSHAFTRGTQRVFRGGDWRSPEFLCRVSHRHAYFANYRDETLGFRMALPVETVQQATGTADLTAPQPAIAPFAAEQAKQHQTNWAKHLGIPAEFTDKHGMKFVLIPPGEFQMGYSQTELDTLTRELKQAGAGEFDLFAAGTSGPQHSVRITQPFYMSAHEVTVAQYRSFLDETKYLPTADQLGGKIKWADFIPKENPDPHPAVGVSWTDADSFCVLRSQKDGVTYRLPSEAEWEYACRAGSTTLWSFGENPSELGEYAVTSSAGVTHIQPVGSRKPNALGLFDMYGNAEEWCRDWHVQDYYAKSPVDDPVNLVTPEDKNSGRVCRGGGVGSLTWQTRSSSRRWDFPSSPVVARGFRVVISGDLKKAIPPTVVGESPNPAIAPFDAVQAKRHQEEWAASLKIPVEHTNSIGMKFQLIPPGEFLMGAPESDADAQANEKPQHVVRLTKPYYIGTIEVTVAHFRRFVEATKYVTQAESDGQGAFDINPKARRPTLVWNGELTRSNLAEAYPVRCVSWEDARRFCEWLGQTEGRTYRLPTEAEWEFACRAGTTTRYSFGNNPTDTTKPPHGNGAPLAPVAQFPANAFGLFDMHGNVNEICWDSGREYTATPVTDPISSIALEMPAVVRSGAVSSNINRMRSSHRFLTDSRKFPEENFATLLKGFRVVLVVDPAASSPTQARVDPIFSPNFEWSAPVNLGPNINTPARESNPSLTSDELLLVFTRDGEFFEARRESRDQPFGQAVKLRGPFANPKPLSTCCLSGDGLQLVFSSLALGEDKQDVLLSRRSSRDEPFGEPLRLPAPINSTDEDRHPALSPDGLNLALTTTRPDQRSGATLLFTRPNSSAEFNPTPIVDPNLQIEWNVITSFSGDGHVLLMTTMSNNVETHTWHTRIGDTNTWSTGQPLPAPLKDLKYGAPFLSSDGSAIYFHSRNLPEGQGELDLWMSRRSPQASGK